MYKEEVLLGIDVGATSIKTGIFSLKGEIISIFQDRNEPEPQHNGKSDWLIWNGDKIWSKVCSLIKKSLQNISSNTQVKSLSVTGFGADGTPLDKDGRQLYPFISWHDNRTIPQRDWFDLKIDPYEIYKITGYHNYHINTINKLRWLRENHPEVLKKTYKWLMMQDYIVYKLTGEFTTEHTIASTMMSMDLGMRKWSEKLLEIAEIDEDIFPELSSPGTVIGNVTSKASEETGLSSGTPVAAGGHDCEIGVVGSGISMGETFVDITGTWEMIIAIMDRFLPERQLFDYGIDFECHTIPGQYLCQSLMIAGGVVEWIRENFYSGILPDDAYNRMIAEAEKEEIGSGGVVIIPSFMEKMGPFRKFNTMGTFLGLTTTTSRSQIIRAVFESLCYQLHQQIKIIEGHSGIKCSKLRVLGGAQKNPFWLKLKTDVTGIPVEIISLEEVTLLGTAILAGIGVGIYKDIEDAFNRINYSTENYQPDKENTEKYENLYKKIFKKIPENLKDVYFNYL